MINNIFTMRILKEYFNKIKDGSKKFEIRLNDEKRKSMKIGDIIYISELTDETSILRLKITSKLLYNSFIELCDNIPLNDIGFENNNIDYAIKEFRKIYSKEEEEQYGVVAIGIEIIK